MEVTRSGKLLAQEGRADDLTLYRDQRTIGLRGKQTLGYSPKPGRVDSAEQNGQDTVASKEYAIRYKYFFSMDLSPYSPMPISISISLMPTKGPPGRPKP